RAARRLPAAHGVRSRPAHPGRLRALLGHQACHRGVRRMAGDHLSQRRYQGLLSLPAGSADPDAARREQLLELPRTGGARAGAGGRDRPGRDRGGALPDSSAPRRRRVLPPQGRRLRPLAPRHGPVPRKGPGRPAMIKRDTSMTSKNPSDPDAIERRSILKGTAVVMGMAAANLTPGAAPEAGAAGQAAAQPARQPAVRESIKITRLETFLVKPRWLFLKVHTNAGITGLGEPITEGRALTCATAVKEIEPYLVGKDPRSVTHHWQAIYRHAFYRGGPILTSALSGIDTALWDIKGKALGVP